MSMPVTVKRWTISELHRLPDDGNKYEVVRGELFVTPSPTPEHETIAAQLARALEPYVRRHSLGLVYRPRAVIRARRSEVEPDIAVRQPIPRSTSWLAAPLPILVVEILSPATRRRDQVQKRNFYMSLSIPEYWIVDDEERTVRVVRPDRDDVVADRVVRWNPAGVRRALRIDVGTIFAQALP
jgi:Uma2 family endonuclease